MLSAALLAVLGLALLLVLLGAGLVVEGRALVGVLHRTLVPGERMRRMKSRKTKDLWTVLQCSLEWSSHSVV